MTAAKFVLDALSDTGRFVGYAIRRFGADRCPESAASLAFTSLLALVPLMAIGLALYSAFPVFDAMRAELQRFLFENFLPHAGGEVEEYLNTFARNTGRLTALGLIGIAVTAVLLLATIERAFGRVWRVAGKRAILVRFLAYWALVTLGPVFFGISLSVSSYLFAAARSAGVESVTGPLGPLTVLMPPLLSFAGFTVLYLVIAYRPVYWRHAAIGAALAAVLFELLKKLFGLYVASFPTYQTVYGALSVLPIMLVWIYACWTIALFGAEVAAALPEWRGHRRTGGGPLTANRRLDLALALLARLAAAHVVGGGVKRRKLLARADAGPAELEAMLADLEARNYVAVSGRDRYLLARDLSLTTLYDLCRDLGLDLGEAGSSGDSGWRAETTAILQRLDTARRQVMDRPLAELLRPTADAEDRDQNADTLRLAHPNQPS